MTAPHNSPKVSNQAASKRFEVACSKYSHNVKDLLPIEIADAICLNAGRMRTQPPAVLASYMTTTATIMAGRVVFKYGPDVDFQAVPAPYIYIYDISWKGRLWKIARPKNLLQINIKRNPNIIQTKTIRTPCYMRR